MNKLFLIMFVALGVLSVSSTISYSEDSLPYLSDRGTGMSTSMLGTYVKKGELLLYPFFEAYFDHNQEYEPADFGFGSTTEYRGKGRAYEGLLFLSYGFTDNLNAEFEIAMIRATLDKPAADVSAMPAHLHDQGLGDVEGQIRYRWNHENEKLPEFFSYFETVFPTGKSNSLIGTSVWEFKFASGLVKGFKWGTVTLRAGADFGKNTFELGEYAAEYMKKLTDRFNFIVKVEGTQDEVEFVPEIQWRFCPNAYLKLNNGFGLTSKTTDFAPEVGIMMSFETPTAH